MRYNESFIFDSSICVDLQCYYVKYEPYTILHQKKKSININYIYIY